LIEHPHSGFISGSSNAETNKPKAKPWASGKTFKPLLKGRRRQTAIVQRISLSKVSMAKVNATTNGREKSITLISYRNYITYRTFATILLHLCHCIMADVK